MGSASDKVMYRISNGNWQEMAYVEEYDPSYLEIVYKWDLTEELMPGRRGSNPVRSTHLWRGKIPTNLETGEHEIEIKVTDMFGRIFTETSSYRLEAPKLFKN